MPLSDSDWDQIHYYLSDIAHLAKEAQIKGTGKEDRRELDRHLDDIAYKVEDIKEILKKAGL